MQGSHPQNQHWNHGLSSFPMCLGGFGGEKMRQVRQIQKQDRSRSARSLDCPFSARTIGQAEFLLGTLRLKGGARPGAKEALGVQ